MNVRTNSVKAWVLAARPKTLSAALIPVMVAAALASHAPQCSWAAIVICALFAALMQIAANLINDLLDFRKGTDGTDRLGPERACAQGWITPRAMRIGIGVVLVLAVMVGSLILVNGQWLMVNGQWLMIGLGAACVLFAFLYTSWLSYAGMGDLLVLVFFGFVPCCGTYFAATGTLCTAAWLAGLTCGVLIDTLLILNNYRDRDTDRRCGKRTLIAILGEKFGRYFYLACGIAAWGLCFLLGDAKGLAFTLPYLLLHIMTWRQMVRIRQGRELNHILGLTSRNMLVFGILLTIALAI